MVTDEREAIRGRVGGDENGSRGGTSTCPDYSDGKPPFVKVSSWSDLESFAGRFAVSLHLRVKLLNRLLGKVDEGGARVLEQSKLRLPLPE